MERSAINARFEPLLRLQRAFEKFRPSEKSHDVTILLAWACVAIGATIAIYALTVPDPADPIDFSTMIAFP
jgi:hypothetical protein